MTWRTHGFLRIRDVACIMGVSASALRSWGKPGPVFPIRTRSRYRLYTQSEAQLLKRGLSFSARLVEQTSLPSCIY